MRISDWSSDVCSSDLLGIIFLVIKGSEYHAEYLEGLMSGAGERQTFHSVGERMFMDGYFIATGLHAFHVFVGVAMLAGCAWRLLGDHPPSNIGLGNIGLDRKSTRLNSSH